MDPKAQVHSWGWQSPQGPRLSDCPLLDREVCGVRRGIPGSACESRSLPGALQVKAVPAEWGAVLGLLLGPGIQGFGQTLQPFLNTIKHRLPCCRLGGWPVLDAPLDWRRKGMVRALPRRGTHTPSLPHRQGSRASPWKPKAAQQLLLAVFREGSDFKTIFCDCFCLYYPVCAPHTHSCSSPK